jgi:hypothetical protein
MCYLNRTYHVLLTREDLDSTLVAKPVLSCEPLTVLTERKVM